MLWTKAGLGGIGIGELAVKATVPVVGKNQPTRFIHRVSILRQKCEALNQNSHN